MKVLMDEKAIGRALTRISYELIEKNKGVEDLVVIGIKTRGVYLAERIVRKIKSVEQVNVPLGELDITYYRDDRKEKSHQPTLNKIDVKDKIVVLVDDVIYTGRTCRAALDAVIDFGRPKKIQFAALIDRGHRELPLRADYVGKNIPTSKEEVVHVLLSEIDEEEKVLLVNKD